MKNSIHIVLLAFLLGACSTANKPEPASAENSAVATTEVALSATAIENAGITTGLAQMENMDESLRVSGVIEVPPQSLVSISFPLGGYLKKTDLLPGMHVNRGQVIALMEDQSYVQLQQDYLQAQARLTMLKADYQRQMELSEAEASSKKSFQQATADLQIQQVLVKSLSEKLLILGVQPNQLSIEKMSRTLAIRSPIDGFVKAVNVNIGKYVNPSDELFEIVDPRDIHAALTVFEKDVSRVKIGQRVKVFSAARPEKHYEAEIIIVSKDIDDSRGAVIHCHFEKGHPELLPGMYVSAAIVLDAQRLPTLPEAAIVRHDGKHYIFTVQEEGKYRMQEISIGEKAGGSVAITANYIDWEKQQVVLSNAYALLGKLMNVEEE